MTNIESLALAIRLPVVGRYLGELMLGIALMVGVTALVGLFVQDFDFAGRASIVFCVIGAMALACRRLPASPDLQVNESLLVIALTFIVGCGAMIWPLMSAGLGFVDATFESISGLTTTGLTTVHDIASKSTAFLFARAWMQWCGGLVIVVLALGLIIEPGPAARRLYGSEGGPETMVESSRMRARRALSIYTLLLLVGTGLLILLGAHPFDALVHSLAAVSTGGFSDFNNSIVGMGAYRLQAGVMFLTLLGAISLVAWPRRWRGDWQRMYTDKEVRGLLLLVLLLTLAMVASLHYGDGKEWKTSLKLAPLLAISAQSTSGFEAVPMTTLGNVSKFLLILAMFIGGGLGSTAGGIKIMRFLLLLRLVRQVFQRTRVSRHTVLDMDITSSTFEPSEAFGMLVMISLFAVVIGVSWVIFLALGFAPMDALFEVVSAVGTVGLSSGITSHELAFLPKAVLCTDMLMGRLEIVAFLLLFYPGTWIGNRAGAV